MGLEQESGARVVLLGKLKNQYGFCFAVVVVVVTGFVPQ